MTLLRLALSGGVLKGKSFQALDTIRPTSQKVREAIFSSLESRFGDLSQCFSHVLDVCSGSGAFSFECLSRGIRKAILIEKRRECIQRLKENSQQLDIDPSTVEISCKDGFVFLEQPKSKLLETQPKGAVIIAFCDPPYEQDPNEWLQAFESSPLKAAIKVIVIEFSKRETLRASLAWPIRVEKTYGDTKVCILAEGSLSSSG